MTTSDTSSTHPSRDGSTIAATISLGKELAGALDKYDFLAQWMSHYVAERISGLEELTGSDREEAEESVADLIRELWAHRAGVELRERPLESIDALKHAVARLDPDRGPWGYFDPLSGGEAVITTDPEIDAAVRIALALDKAMGDVVHALIAYATLLGSEKDARWIRRADEAGLDPLGELKAILGGYGAPHDDGDPHTAAKQRIKDAAETVISALNVVSADRWPTDPETT